MWLVGIIFTYHRIVEYPELGGNHKDHPVQPLYRTSRIPAWWCWSVFLGTFSSFGIVSAGTSPNPGNTPILWNCSWLSGWCSVVLKDEDRSCWNKCQLVVLIWVKLVFHDGNPGSQGDLELKTELLYYWIKYSIIYHSILLFSLCGGRTWRRYWLSEWKLLCRNGRAMW